MRNLIFLSAASLVVAASANPLINSWTGPYGGVPPFALVKVTHFKPAIKQTIREYRRDIKAIVSNQQPATFDNTLVALENAGRRFHAVMAIYGVWSSSMNSADFQKVEHDLAPKLAAFGDEVTQNKRLFRRIEAVYNSPAKSKLTAEQQRLLWRQYTSFVLAGARLDAASKLRMTQINQRLASLYTKFNQHLLADEEKQILTVDGQVVTNTRSSVEPFLTNSAQADAREKVWKAFVSRGDNGDANDNKVTITEILKLRAEKAKLLGFQSYAHWSLENSMAKTPERAMALMESVWGPAVARVHEEVADMQAIADAEGESRKIAPWDYRYYAEKVRKAKYDLDEKEVKPYLQLEKLREGMFWVAGELFGLAFTPAKNVPVYHPDVRVWEVKNKVTGKHVGLWYFDPYARSGKRSGAWMEEYRAQERFKDEIAPMVTNCANFIKTKEGEPVLLSWDDARTLFHEFGHALHGLSSNVTYPTLSGTKVARDYVEFPSQFLEHWLSTPEVLNRFALHVETGAPIPKVLVQKIEKAAKFNQGFKTVEALSAALVDMKLHLAGSASIDPAVFERETLQALGMPAEIVMRHRMPQFGHIFSSDGYAAGYYSYLWADTISADAYEAFLEGTGPYDKSVAERLRRHVFSVGDSIDPATGYQEFRGKEAGIGGLMRSRGFE